jgi:hypothetical protein
MVIETGWRRLKSRAAVQETAFGFIGKDYKGSANVEALNKDDYCR